MLSTLISLNQHQIESENEEYPYICFSMGIDHSNPYIHSTTILCDGAWSSKKTCI